MAIDAVNAVGRDIYNVMQNVEGKTSGDSEALWREVQEGYDRLSPADQRRLNEQMIEDGVVPRLSLDIWDHFDSDKDGEVTQEELKEARKNSEQNPAVQMAAQYLLDHFEEIDTTGDIVPYPMHLADGVIDRDDIKAFSSEVEKRYPNPDQYYADESRDEEEGAERRSDQSRSDRSNEVDSPQLRDVEDCMDVLHDNQATPQEKLAAVEKLADFGQTEVTILDENGQPMRFKVVVKEIGNGRKYVHLFDAETNQIVLRGINDNGQFQKEAGVEFVGDRWSARHGRNPLMSPQAA